METNTEDKLILIARKAQEQQKLKFTSLTHLLNASYLKGCYKVLKKKKAAGVDGRTVESYSEEEIKQVLGETERQILLQKYRPKPVKRVYIEKENGNRRPLGMPTVIDKVVQMGIARILEAIYEPTFLTVSYGFRRGQNPHECLKEVNHMIMGRKVNWIIEADIEGYFDHIDHEWMMRCLSERVADPTFKMILYRFLKAGVMEEGRYEKTGEGTPQGGIISPLLANIYLHYILDVWFEGRVKKGSRGYIQLVRYADDFVIGVQQKEEAIDILNDLKERLKEFGLKLSVEKTRIIEFGRFAEENRRRRGERKPETFDFLGFTHYCSETVDGRFQVRVKTMGKKMNRSIIGINRWLKSIRNKIPLPEIWEKIAEKLRGHYQYYGVSGNFEEINRYYHRSLNGTIKWLNRRSQKKSWNWEGFHRYLMKYPLPRPQLTYAFYNTW